MDLSIKLNLLKLEKAAVVSLQGKTKKVKCIVIPVEENDIYVSQDENTGAAKSAYLDLIAWESREPKFGDTHYVRQSFSETFTQAMGKDALQERPILGNARELKRKNTNAIGTVDAPPVEVADDLPF